jgi:glycosyltransferase involved in cell wall biosynthesis
MNFYAHLLARACGAVAIGGVRSGFDRMRQDTARAVWPLCLRYPGVIACNSGPAAQRLAALDRPWAPHTTLVVPNAIDLRRFPQAVAHGPRTPLRLIGVGNLRDEKRWHLAIEAVARLNAEGTPCRLEILGRGPLREALERRIAELGVRDSVQLPGNVESVDAHLLASDVLLHTAGSEGSPNAVLEGMSAGLACVATAVGEVPALLAGERGLVVGLDDLEGLIGALRRAGSDPQLRARLGRAARAYAEHHFDVGSRTHEWQQIYDALLAGREVPRFRPEKPGATHPSS